MDGKRRRPNIFCSTGDELESLYIYGDFPPIRCAKLSRLKVT